MYDQLRLEIDFDRHLRPWDGFGVNYVQAAQTPDYDVQPQDYGGFSILSGADRQAVLDMIFGADGLRPGLVKMFLDPFHQAAPGKPYDHVTTTRWMRTFAREGLARTRARGDDLQMVTTLYGPPGWMTRQGFVRGRDLDPAHREDLARYMIDWVAFLREEEGLPVRYLSLHNEGESYYRWPEDGDSPNWEHGHDYNLYWPPQQVVDFLKLMRPMLDARGLEDVGLTPGETTNLVKFLEWGYAWALVDHPEAAANLGLITSHGFLVPAYNQWYADVRSAGFDLLRAQRPELHAWITSCSWHRADVEFVNDLRHLIYAAKVNAIIPWACIQRPTQWYHRRDPNPITAFYVSEAGEYEIQQGYYFYKQVCRAGQPGMAVCRVICNDAEVGLLAFAGNGSGHPDAFVVLNLSDREKTRPLTVRGSTGTAFNAYRTSETDRYRGLGTVELSQGEGEYTFPPRSVTTFYTAD
jgi:O-glycosyl hydrolase